MLKEKKASHRMGENIYIYITKNLYPEYTKNSYKSIRRKQYSLNAGQRPFYIRHLKSQSHQQLVKGKLKTTMRIYYASNKMGKIKEYQQPTLVRL